MSCSIKDCKLFLIPDKVLSGEGGGWLWISMQTRAIKEHSVILFGINLINLTGQGLLIILPRSIF